MAKVCEKDCGRAQRSRALKCLRHYGDLRWRYGHRPGPLRVPGERERERRDIPGPRMQAVGLKGRQAGPERLQNDRSLRFLRIRGMVKLRSIGFIRVYGMEKGWESLI